MTARSRRSARGSQRAARRPRSAPSGKRYEGTDRQCRGRLLAVLRDSREPVAQARLDAVWPDAVQRARALDGLVADGLVDPLPTDASPSRPDARCAVRATACESAENLSASSCILSACGWVRTVTKMGVTDAYYRMWTDADSDEEGWRGYDRCLTRVGPGRPGYWRRRFFILCGGVVALGRAPGCFPPPSSRRRARWPSPAPPWPRSPGGRRCPRPPTAARGPRHPTPRRRRPPAPVATRRPAPPAGARAATAGELPPTSPSPAPSAVGAARRLRCAPADIVLSLFTSQPSYAKGARPSVQRLRRLDLRRPLHAAATAPGSVQVVVTRHGHVVWDSAACKRPAAGAVRFTRASRRC